MLALPDSLYDDAFLRLTRANLLIAAGRDADAAKQLENPFVIGLRLGIDGLRMMQRGRVTVWRHADPEASATETEEKGRDAM
jgi:hypothetical protein